MSTKIDLGFLIDGTEEEFREYCKDKDFGYISSFHNLMIQTYNEVQKVKDELVQVMGRKSQEERTEEEKHILEGLYSKLLRIEQRVFILREIMKERQITLNEVPCSGT